MLDKNKSQTPQNQLKLIYRNRKSRYLREYYIKKIKQTNDPDLIRFYLQQIRRLG